MLLPEDNQPDQNVDGDLHWLAFRYAMGELAGAEEAAFEQRLAEDPSAREALEQVVELKTAMRIAAADSTAPASTASPLAAPAPSSDRRSWATWAVAAVTGIALTVSVVWLIRQNAQRPEDHASQQAGDEAPGAKLEDDEANSASLAAAWAALRRREVLDPAQRAVEWELEDEADAVPMLADTDVGGAELPDWLLTAVAGENEGDR